MREEEELVLSFESDTFKPFIARFNNVIGTDRDFVKQIVQSLREDKEYCVWTNVLNKHTYCKDIALVIEKILFYSGAQRIFHVSCEEEPLARSETARIATERAIALGILSRRHLSLLKVEPASSEVLKIRPPYLSLGIDITKQALDWSPLFPLKKIIEKSVEEIIIK